MSTATRDFESAVDAPIGARRHKIRMENPGNPQPDGDGGFTPGWTLLADVWAAVMPASARDLERLVAGTVTALAPFLVVIRYLDGVSTLTRVTYHGRELAVLGVRNIGELNTRLEMICEERQPAGSPAQAGVTP